MNKKTRVITSTEGEKGANMTDRINIAIAYDPRRYFQGLFDDLNVRVSNHPFNISHDLLVPGESCMSAHRQTIRGYHYQCDPAGVA